MAKQKTIYGEDADKEKLKKSELRQILKKYERDYGEKAGKKFFELEYGAKKEPEVSIEEAKHLAKTQITRARRGFESSAKNPMNYYFAYVFRCFDELLKSVKDMDIIVAIGKVSLALHNHINQSTQRRLARARKVYVNDIPLSEDSRKEIWEQLRERVEQYTTFKNIKNLFNVLIEREKEIKTFRSSAISLEYRTQFSLIRGNFAKEFNDELTRSNAIAASLAVDILHISTVPPEKKPAILKEVRDALVDVGKLSVR